MECLANRKIPIAIRIIGKNGINMVNGINKIEKTPVIIPRGRTIIMVIIIENKRKINLKGMLKYKNLRILV